MSRVPKEGLALLLTGKGKVSSDDEPPPSSRRGADEPDPDDEGDGDEKEQLDRIWTAIKGDDREEFDDALVSLIHVCLKEP